MSEFKLEDFTHYKDFPNVEKITNKTKQRWIDMIVEEYKKFLIANKEKDFWFSSTSGDTYIIGEGNRYCLNILVTGVYDRKAIYASEFPATLSNKKE